MKAPWHGQWPGSGRGDPGSPSTAVPLLPAAAALAVAVLVAVASRGAPVWAELRDGQAERAQLLDRLVTVGTLGLIAAAAATFLYHFLVVVRRPGAPPLSQTLARALPVIAISVAFLVLLTIARAGRPERPSAGGAMQMDWFPGLGLATAPQVTGTGAPAEPRVPQTGAPLPENPDLSLLLLALLGAAMVAGAFWWWRSRGARREDTLEGVDEAPPMSETVAAQATLTRTIEAMLADPDPRTAIIGAYARLLDGLASCDLPRHEHEAPVEHLQRALEHLRVTANPLRELVRLFEIARFSTHALAESHRQQALRALRRASEDLRRAHAAAPEAPDPMPALTAP